MTQHSNIKIFRNSGSLSETDLVLLTGTDTILAMMRNRLVVSVDTTVETDWGSLIENVYGLYHIRPLDKAKSIYQIWFEQTTDMDKFEKNTMLTKLSATA
jgi:hypothetical protein